MAFSRRKNMKKILLFCLLVGATSLFALNDSDMDGVDDAHDRCPNTPFMDLVDINGCSKESLVTQQHYDVIIGATYADADYNTLNKTNTLSSTLQVDYYYKNFSLQASTSYFKTKGSGYSDTGFYDTFMGASYQFKFNDALSVRIGGGAILPTYSSNLNNNKTDYTASASLSYMLDDINIFGGYSYTMIGDTNVVLVDANGTRKNIEYKNINGFYGGLGYYISKKTYASLSYNNTQSIYVDVKDLQSATFYMYHNLDIHWFTTFSYARGLSKTATKNYAAIRLGYYF